jgi:hypothetical protein
MAYAYVLEVHAQPGKLAELVDKFNSEVLPTLQAHPLYVSAEVLLDLLNEIAILTMRTASPCPGASEFTEQQMYKVAEQIVEPVPPRGFAIHPLGSPLQVAD